MALLRRTNARRIEELSAEIDDMARRIEALRTVIDDARQNGWREPDQVGAELEEYLDLTRPAPWATRALDDGAPDADAPEATPTNSWFG